MQEFRFDLAQFTPSEAENITGLALATQRDWRRRGFLHKGIGHNRFDLFDLIEMLARKMLSDRGIGPLASESISDFLVSGISHRVLDYDSCFKADSAKLDADAPEFNFDRFSRLIRVKKFGNIASVIPARFFLWFANGKHQWVKNIADCFEDSNSSYALTNVAGPVIILDQEAIAKHLIKKISGRPLVFVKSAE